MYKVTRTTKTDTRSPGATVPSQEDLMIDSLIHMRDVNGLFMYFLRRQILPDVISHDYTKITEIRAFRENFRLTLEDGEKFLEQQWYKHHIAKEPHHALEYSGPVELHLGHIIHMIVDWVAAGKARDTWNGPYRPSSDYQSLLVKAFENTIKWFDNNTEAVDGVVRNG